MKAHLEALREEHLEKVWSKCKELTERLNELEDVEDDIGELRMEKLWMKERLNQLELLNFNQIGELRAMREQFTNDSENLKRQNKGLKEKNKYLQEKLDSNTEEIRRLRWSEQRRIEENMGLISQMQHLQNRFETHQGTTTNKVQEMSRVVQNLYSKSQATSEKQTPPHSTNRKQFSTPRNPETTKEAVAFDPDNEMKKRKIKEAECKYVNMFMFPRSEFY